MMKKRFDVVVVGGGGSGLATAVSAAQHGASVLVLERRPQLGGATGISVGSFTANRTRLQAQAGVIDDLDAHEQDTAKFAEPHIEARDHHDLRRFFLSHSADTLHWLMDLGLHFYGPSPEPPNRVARMHNVVPGAKAYVATLQAHLARAGGTVLCGATVTRLVKSGPGVTGVVARVDGVETEFTAGRGVVLAAGYYAPELVARFRDQRFANVETLNADATGDGHRLAEEVGAKLVNMDVAFGPVIMLVPPQTKALTQLLPSRGPIAALLGWLMPILPRFVLNAFIKRLLVIWQHPQETLFDDGAILVNASGQRFCDERATPDREIGLSRQPDGQGFILLDARLMERYSRWPHCVSTAPGIAYAYVNDYQRLRRDATVAAASPADVAQRRGFPPGSLEATVDAFNRYVTGDEPDPFGRTGDAHRLSGDSWLLLGPVKAYFAGCEGGVAINQCFQALDQDDQPIPGLYAVGQNGIGGQILMAHGLHIAWAMTSGRLAGKLLATGRIED